MSQTILFFCVVVGLVVYELSSFSSDFDDPFSVNPIVLTSNNILKERNPTKATEYADKSPLFRSLKMRVAQVFP
jgi:hypothetical protein